jgi:hypothetical protein
MKAELMANFSFQSVPPNRDDSQLQPHHVWCQSMTQHVVGSEDAGGAAAGMDRVNSRRNTDITGWPNVYSRTTADFRFRTEPWGSYEGGAERNRARRAKAAAFRLFPDSAAYAGLDALLARLRHPSRHSDHIMSASLPSHGTRRRRCQLAQQPKPSRRSIQGHQRCLTRKVRESCSPLAT